MRKKHVLQWHITHKCNLRCSHCYQEEYCEDLSYSKLENIFYQYMKFLQVKRFKGHINFTGGEPFIYKDIFKLFDLCEKHNISFGILTNGTLLNEDIVEKLNEYRKLSFVQVSIDGLKSTHEKIRGEGTFDKAFEGLQLLKEYGIQTMVSFTCHKDNYKDLKKVIRFVERNKIDRFWTDRLIPLGDNEKEEVNKSKVLSTMEYKQVIKTLTMERKLAQLNPFCKTEIHTNRALQFCENHETVYQCSAGVSLLTILANGEILPCRRLPISFGNVTRDTILNLYDNSELIQDLKKKKIPKECNQCEYSKLCRGGAKCLSYALHKNYLMKDVNCYHQLRR